MLFCLKPDPLNRSNSRCSGIELLGEEIMVILSGAVEGDLDEVVLRRIVEYS